MAAFGPFGLPPSPSIDNPVVLDSVSAPDTRHTADFQVTPSGDVAAFPSTLALAGHEEETAGHTEVYRYDAQRRKARLRLLQPHRRPLRPATRASPPTASASPTTAASSSTPPIALVAADTDDKAGRL